MAERKSGFHIIAIDCCEHLIATFRQVSSRSLANVTSTVNHSLNINGKDIDLIVVGVSKYPVRRLFMSQLRRIYPHVPILILRRNEGADHGEEQIHGDLVLSDRAYKNDLEVVQALREILPVASCTHLHRGDTYEIVRKVITILAKRHSDPKLSLNAVATELKMPPKRLSHVLNRQVGISFRHLLCHTRIEEAKQMLASKSFSVKEVAAKSGFSDSHYFSRSFKRLTGINARDYRSQYRTFI